MKKIVFLFLFKTWILSAQTPDVIRYDKGLVSGKVDTVRVLYLANKLAECPDPDSETAVRYNDSMLAAGLQGLKQNPITPSEKEQYLSTVAAALSNRGNYYERHDSVVKAFDAYSKANEYASSLTEYNTREYLLINLGILYSKVGNYERATKNYFEALRSFENQEDEEGKAYALENIANLYQESEQYELALTYYLKLLKGYYSKTDKPGDMGVKATLLHNIGHSCYKLGQDSMAYVYLNQCMQLSQRINAVNVKAAVLLKYGMLQERKGNNVQAHAFYNESIRTATSDELKSKIELTLAEFYVKTRQPDKAREHFLSALKLTSENGYLVLQSEAAKGLYKLYRQQGNYKQALEMNEMFHTLMDKLGLEKANNALINQQLKYDYEKKELAYTLRKEQQLAALQMKAVNERARKNLWIALFVFLLCSITAIAVIVYRAGKQRKALVAFEKNSLNQKLLLSQMNPHFIFNSIDTIQGLIHAGKHDLAISYLSRFSGLTRQILEYATQTYIPFEEEIEMIKNYLSIQQMLHANHFTFEFTIDDAIDQGRVMVPPMLTQPFIENAIKHGLASKQEPGHLYLAFKLISNQLFFEVRDNGKGFVTKPTTVTGHKSMAIKIVNDRLKTYSVKTTIHEENLTDETGKVTGARVFFEIPYIYEK